MAGKSASSPLPDESRIESPSETRVSYKDFYKFEWSRRSALTGARRRTSKRGSEVLDTESCNALEDKETMAEASTIGPSPSAQAPLNDDTIVLPPGLDSRLQCTTLNDPFTAIFSAMLYNGSVLNFDLTQMRSCLPTVLSPFYDPNINISDDPVQILESASAKLP